MRRKYKILYPKLANAIRARGTITDFLAATDLTESSYFKVITGLVAPRKSTIDKMLWYTGLTYEEAFHEEENT